MDKKFNNKYRIPSARLLNYDYAWEGLYFITICTKNKEHFFGKIENGQMELNILGNQVITEWLNTPMIRPDMNLELGEFVVMPNHFHAVIYIGKNKYNSVETQCIASNHNTQRIENTETQCNENTETQCNENTETQCNENIETQCHKNVETQCIASLQGRNKFQPQSKNLASIVRGFKSSVTSFARKNGIPFDWQSRYYDRVIRDETELRIISNYIVNNPENWEEDDYNTP